MSAAHDKLVRGIVRSLYAVGVDRDTIMRIAAEEWPSYDDTGVKDPIENEKTDVHRIDED